jgi:hypothetical protein
MRRPVALLAVALAVAGLPAIGVGIGSSLAGAAGGTRSISASGTGQLQGGPAGSDSGPLQFPEFAAQESEDQPAPGVGPDVNRSQSGGPGQGASTTSGKKAKSNPELTLSFDGLNHRQQRLANGGNQFSVEPPDQGLCVGNGFVMETVNDVIRVFDSAGNPLTAVVDQNSFYGYPPAIVRPSTFGPFVTDPSCLYDADTQRWFHVVLTLDRVGTTGALSGKNHLDIAVSNSPNPTGSWTIYRLPVQDDGTDGTPDHNCPLSNDGSGHGPCLGDYPHIGADANGFYITTNEYAFFPDNIFHAAQIYAFSKSALASNSPSVVVTQIDTLGADNGNPGFTVWPSTSPAGSASRDNHGTEFFMSSNAAEEANGNGSSTELLVWTLSNTSSLNTASPSLNLTHAVAAVGTYTTPPKSDQKAGDFPLGQCLNDPACATFLNGEPDPFAPEVLSHLDSNDTRMQQVWYANGKLWGALGTAATINGANKAGIEWFIVNPSVPKVDKRGYLALANNNLTYPAIATTPGGRGVMAFTVVGADNYPSAGYAPIDVQVGVGDIHVAAAGLGPDDGFTSYKYYVGDPPRTRWGDYGAAAVDGNSIWIASEFIGQTCTLEQYLSAPVGSCGGTRSALGNWSTRISKLTP